MSNNNRKQTRARAPEKKAEQFEKILALGREMFVKFGSHGFSMRALAKELGMTQPNLYNYVSSKRELWIAIRKKYFKELNDGINRIIKEKEGSFIDVFMDLSRFFLEFAAADYKRFSMIFLISAPPSKKVGPLEEEYEPFQSIKIILDFAQNVIKEKNLDEKKYTTLIYHFFGTLLGAAMTEADLKLHHKITEPITGDFFDLPAKDYREFVLNEIRERIEGIFY